MESYEEYHPQMPLAAVRLALDKTTSPEVLRTLRACGWAEELPDANLRNLLPRGSVDTSGKFRKRFI